MSADKKTSTIPRQSSCNSLFANPLNELKHNRSCSEGGNGNNSNCVPLAVHIRRNQINDLDKENVTPNKPHKGYRDDGKENVVPGKVLLKDKPLKPSSLQLCMQKHEPDSAIGMKSWEPIDSGNSNSGNIWDYSDSEAAPASSWSTLPNRSLLCRPLPVDIGRCTCVIVKESSPEGLNGGALYSLYTHEGQGRQNRKLAVAHQRRHNGRSEFLVASNIKAMLSCSDDSLIGNVTANLIGSKYHIREQGSQVTSLSKQSKLLAVVTFRPTVATWTGSYRSVKAWIPKHQSMQLKNTTQHMNGLPKDWKEKKEKVHQLFSRVPHYNKVSNQYELDFRDTGRTGLRIQSSVKNFQLTLEKNGRQTILQLGRVGKSKYVMDYRYPLTGFQAFSICLAAMDSKPCCTV